MLGKHPVISKKIGIAGPVLLCLLYAKDIWVHNFSFYFMLCTLYFLHLGKNAALCMFKKMKVRNPQRADQLVMFFFAGVIKFTCVLVHVNLY